jgi:glycosyltransferase involved in cell wall biosynthesis
LNAYIAGYGLKPHITLSGFRPNPLPYFRQADLFCLSSLYEGMPNALLEAMLCRVPVIATDCPSGPREVLAGGRFGRLIPPADSRALAEAIDEAVTHPERSRALVPAAREHIERTFSPADSMQKLEELLVGLVHVDIA